MHIDPLEKEWVYVTLAMTALFIGVILLTSFFHGVNAPSHVETIDSARLHLSEEFGEDNLGVKVKVDGGVVVRVVAGRYGFFPRYITIPAETKITFRWVSMDVLHGVHIPMTNMSTMILPGYVAEVTTIFPKPGDYPILCNEYCGLGHDHMWSQMKVVAVEDWEPPAKTSGAAEISSEGGERNE